MKKVEGDPKSPTARRKLVEALLQGEKVCATEIAKELGISSASITRFLKRLSNMRYAKRTKEERFLGGRPKVYYSLTPRGKRFFKKWISKNADVGGRFPWRNSTARRK